MMSPEIVFLGFAIQIVTGTLRGRYRKCRLLQQQLIVWKEKNRHNVQTQPFVLSL